MLNTIIPNTSINDLQKDLFIQTKFRMGKEDYSDIELLKYLSLYYNDNITLPSILLFGNNDILSKILREYNINTTIKGLATHTGKEITINTNLLDSYNKLSNFIISNINNKFFLDGDKRISIHSYLATELSGFILLNRDYSNLQIPTITISRENIIINSTKCKDNAILTNIFNKLNITPSIDNIIKYNNIYSNSTPIIEDKDGYKITIKL